MRDGYRPLPFTGSLRPVPPQGGSGLSGRADLTRDALWSEIYRLRAALQAADAALNDDPRAATGYGSGSPDVPALGIIRAALAVRLLP